MDNVFTWLIIIGAVISLVNKASGKNNQKPGTNQNTRPNPTRPNQDRANQAIPNQDRLNQNRLNMNRKMPNSIQKFMDGLQQVVQAETGTQMKTPARPMSGPGMMNQIKASPVVDPGLMMKGSVVIPENQNYGEGFADEEGTSFGDGSKGTEGECDEAHGHQTITESIAAQEALEESTPWNLNGENLMTAFVYSEILSTPKCRGRHVR